MITFNNIPDSRVPYMFVEFDNSEANSNKQIWKTLIIGYKLSSSSANLNTLYNVVSEKQAIDLFGNGSNLHHQVKAYKDNDETIETWCIAVNEGEREASAILSFDFVDATQPIGDGIVSLLLFGEVLDIPVKSTKDIKDIVKTISDAITANTKEPVNALPDATNPKQINFKTIHKSSIYNYGYSIIQNTLENKPLPANLKITTPDKANIFSGGVGEPDIISLFKNVIKDLRFNSIVSPFYSANFSKNISDILDQRWSAANQIDGINFLSTTMSDINSQIYKDCFSTLNSEFIFPYCYANSLSPAYIINAAVAAQVSLSASIDPAMPLHSLKLKGVKPPLLGNRLSFIERNALVNSGFGSVNTINETATIERSITSYKYNDSGIPDDSYLNAEKVLTLSYIRYDFKSYFWSKYNRCKLADDGSNFASGQKVITPNIAKSEAIACFLKWEQLGLVQNSKAFIDNIVVERNKNNRGRLDFLLPPTLIDQLIQVSVQIQFR